MACCLVAAYLFGSIWRRIRRGGAQYDQSAWLAYYYESTVKPSQAAPTHP